MKELKLNSQFAPGEQKTDAPVSDNGNILLFVGRSNFRKGSVPLQRLTSCFNSSGSTVIWYESRSTSTAKLLDSACKKYNYLIEKSVFFRYSLLQKILKAGVRIAVLLAHPDRWDHFLHIFLELFREEPISAQAKDLRRFIQRMGVGKPISILSHSSGGRISSLIQDEAAIDKIVCFGYPFKHPDMPPEPLRTQHLAAMTKPLLIIQGKRDQYGGMDALERYSFAPGTQMTFVDTDHDYDPIPTPEWDALSEKIREFIKSK